jgi:lipopolysaccharide transport system permease protein
LTGGSSSVANNASLIGKAYFPRVYAPVAAVAAPLVDFVLASVVLAGLFAWYRWLPSWHIIFLPVFVAALFLMGFGVSLWLSGVTVKYRDLPFALPFLIQMGMYATPIIYPVTLVPEQWRWLTTINPLTGIINGVRWSLFGTNAPGLWALVASVALIAVLVVTGLYFFRRTERTIADVL